MGRIEHDEHGNMLMFAARAPGQVAAQRDPSGVVVLRGAVSGNPNFDPATGRFAGHQAGRRVSIQGKDVVITQQSRTLPQGVTQQQWERRQDLVRAAAREMDSMGAGDAKEFLRGHPNIVLSKVNIDLFLRDVRAQRMDDLLDIMDQNLRRNVKDAERARRHVKLAAPKGFTQRVFNGLTNEEMLQLTQRLESRGWNKSDIVKHVVSKITNEQRKAQFQQIYGEPAPKRGKRKA